VLCVLCEFHKQECTFVQDPQPRKRKVAGDAEKKDCLPKKRYVHAKTHNVLCRNLIAARETDIASSDPSIRLVHRHQNRPKDQFLQGCRLSAQLKDRGSD